MADYASAASKPEAVARMYYLGGMAPEPLGPGSKEKRSALEALARSVSMDLTAVRGKVECGRRLAEVARVTWDSQCHSAGDTITLTGMNRLVDGVVDMLVEHDPTQEQHIVDELMALAPVPRQLTERAESASMEMIAADTQGSIAEFIATLSAVGDSPNGVEFTGTNLSANDIRFDDGTWRHDIARIQGWLNFAQDLDTSSPEGFDGSLIGALQLDPQASDTEAVTARLLERLDRAANLRSTFEETLEDATEGGATLGSASQAWEDAWQEIEDEDESEGSGPISASADIWPIVTFVQHAKDDILELSPSYQRADVWPTRNAQQLIESILRGIPLPSVILLKHATNRGTTYEVVDGKQRLTSILRFTGTHPVAIATVKEKAEAWGEPHLENIFRNDYRAFRKLWKKYEADSLTDKIDRKYYFPFALRKGDVTPLSGELEFLRGKYYSEVRDELMPIVGEKKKVVSLFEQHSQYKVPVIVYDSANPAQVHDVFTLYNKQGKHLNAEEIRNANYHRLALMRSLLVTSGDSENVETVAPHLAEFWDDLSSTAEVLDNYGFGKAGYKRTKVLSWVLAALTVEDDAQAITRSTSAHINLMLKAVDEGPKHRLRSEEVVLEAMLLLDHAVDAHAAIPDETWAPSFKAQQKWQELQLVGTLVALAAASAVFGDELESVVESKLEELASVSATPAWRRPAKTQSKEQWKHTGRVVASMLETLGVDSHEADESLRSRFGTSGLLRLTHMSTH